MKLPFYISWTKQKDASTFPIEKVDGVYLYTDKNKKIIDMSSISYQAHFGHNHPVIINSINKQLKTIPMSSPKGIYKNKISTTQKLLNYMQKDDGKIFYTTSGAESVENALKIARDISKKKIVLARKESYHGATLGALSATGDWRNPYHQTPTDWIVRIPEPNEENALDKTRDIIQQIGSENIAGIILETITGGNGVIIPNREWWKGIQALCNEFKLFLIMDEVVCGFERTGLPFGYMHYEVQPDLICLAKGISGGMIPFGAVWTSEKISMYYEENILCCGLTNYAHPLGVAALEGVLEIVSNDKFINELRYIETCFHSHLLELLELSQVITFRQTGLLAAIELKTNIEWKTFFHAGIYLVAQKNRIILAPPLIINEKQLFDAMKIIFKIIKESK